MHLRGFLAVHLMVADGPQLRSRIVRRVLACGEELVPLLLTTVVHQVSVDHQRARFLRHGVEAADGQFVILRVVLRVGDDVDDRVGLVRGRGKRRADRDVVHGPPVVIVAAEVAKGHLHGLGAFRHVELKVLVGGVAVVRQLVDDFRFPTIETHRNLRMLAILALAVVLVELEGDAVLAGNTDRRGAHARVHGVALGKALLLRIDDGELVVPLGEKVPLVGAGGPGPVAHIRDGPAVPAGLARGHTLDVLRPALRQVVGEMCGVRHPVEAFEVQVRAGGLGEGFRLGGVSGNGERDGDGEGGGDGNCVAGHHASKISAT